MTPNQNYETQKTEAVEKFINRIMPFWAANNSINNMKIYLTHEFEKFYSDAFADGQENVLNDPEYKKQAEKITLF